MARYKLIACEILYREFCHLVGRSPHRIDIEFMPKGLHDLGRKGMFARLNETLAAVDTDQYDAVLLGYALCSNGIVGLKAHGVPLVVPRAHDCITLFLGDGRRYLDYFNANPGTYFKTSGWIERGDDLVQFSPDSIQDMMGMNMAYEELVDKYGVENAKYLLEQLGQMQNYGRLTYIAMGVGPDEHFESHSRQLAESKGWQFERLDGDLSLLSELIDGSPWDDARFLVLQPGESIAPSHDATILQAEKPSAQRSAG